MNRKVNLSLQYQVKLITKNRDDLLATSSTRSKRKATVFARMKIKNWLNPEESFLVGECRGLRVMMSLMT